MNATENGMLTAGTRKVLLIDDDPDYLTVLRMAIKSIPGVETATAASAEDGLEKLDTDSFDLILTDLNLPGRSGLELISAARERGYRMPILVLTAHGSVSAAVEALKLGAADYLQKPVEPERLRALVETLIKDSPAVTRPQPSDPMSHGDNDQQFEGILGVSQSMREVFDRISRVGATDATVLIVGESGTGKELVARAIHRRSQRIHGPFVPVHTGAIPRELIASELFGHEKGSFTGAVTSADGKFDAALRGTLFLDEIGTMETAVQVALLRVLETFKFTRVGGRKERDADVRIVAATNRDLLDMVKEGTFREDLYYRLNVFTIALPPLRERLDDVALIAQHYLTEFGARYRMPARRFSPAALERLYSHAWPGNVRELRNVMEQTAVFARGEEVQVEEVQLVSTHIANAVQRSQIQMTPSGGVGLPVAESFHASHAAPHPQPAAPHATPSDAPPPVVDTRPPAPMPSPAPNTPVLTQPARPMAIAPAQPSPLAPFAAMARSTLGAIASNHSDDALVLRFPIGTTVEEAEKQLILRTLEVIGGNKQKAARVLGISRRCLYNKLASYGISTAVVHDDEPHEAEGEASTRS